MLGKCVLIGNPCSGKTSIFRRFSMAEPPNGYIPSPEPEEQKVAREMGPIHIETTVFDIPGAHDGQNLLADIDVAIIPYDITSKSSYRAIDGCVKRIREFSPEAQVIVTANKIDQKANRVTKRIDGINKAKQFKGEYIEVSASTGEGIEDLITMMTGMIFTRKFAKEHNLHEDLSR